jgi:hypothetical protein
MSNELEDFVGNEEAPQEETVETTAESQEVESQEETSTPDAPEKGVTDEPPSSTEEHQETMIPLAAKQAEKERRKQAESEAQRLREELARFQGMQQAQQKQTPKDAPDPYTDPEGYYKHQAEQLTQRQQAQKTAELKTRLTAAEEVARTEITDYDKYADIFAEQVAPNNPNMVNAMLYAPDPAKYAYIMGKKYADNQQVEQQINQAGGLEAYRAQIEAQIREQIAAEKPEAKIPPDLTSVSSTGEPAGDAIGEGTESLNRLLGR